MRLHSRLDVDAQLEALRTLNSGRFLWKATWVHGNRSSQRAVDTGYVFIALIGLKFT